MKHLKHIAVALALLVALFAFVAGGHAAPKQPACDSEQPCPVPGKATVSNDVPRVGGELFSGRYQNPNRIKEKRLWAASYLYCEAPKLEVEEWLGDRPDTKGKYVLLEVWNTWCPPCRRSIELLNRLHKKFGEELVVIALCDEEPDVVEKMTKAGEHKMECYNAIDTRKRTRDALEVVGVPHAIVIEPGGYVVWEGFPLQPGFELTGEKIERILAVGRKLKQGEGK